jgi:hypothetical protein
MANKKAKDSDTPTIPPIPISDTEEKQTKAARLIVENIQNGSKKQLNQILIEAGYSELTATRQTPRTVANCCNNAKMKEALEKAGVTYDTISQKIQEGLDANRTISAIGNADGKSTDFVEVPDHTNRRGYLDMANKIHGTYAAEKKETEHKGSIDVNTTEAKDLMEWLKDVG